MKRPANIMAVAATVLAPPALEAGTGRPPARPPARAPTSGRRFRATTRVIDADTVDIDGIRYRLSGIDAPESHQTCRAWGRTWDCGSAAPEALMSRAGGIFQRDALTGALGGMR